MAADVELIAQRKRIAWLATVFGAIAIGLFSRLVQWQLLPQPQLRQQAWTLADLTNRIPATRGNIRDATGHYLVASNVHYTVGASPRLLSQPQREALAPVLAEIVARPEEEVLEALSREDREYIVIAERVPFWTAMAVEDLRTSALRVDVGFGREYPDGQLAASVLGFQMTRSDNAPVYGLEQYYDAELRGQDGAWRGLSDLWGQQILVSERGYQPAHDGADLILTIDRNIQFRAEEILRRYASEYEAIGGDIIVLNPSTGAVLAMAGHPSYTPARYWEVASGDVYVNTAISTIYEPGSVFKPLTLAAALEARVVAPTDTYDDRGEILVGTRRIFNSDLQAHGRTTMTEMLAYSRNVGAAHIAALLGPTRFYETIRKLGFSESTGIDLWGEVPGIMRVPGNPYWHVSDLGANAYGQGIAVTPIQVAAAFAALANDGMLMRPYIVAEVQSEGERTLRRPFAVRQVVSPEVADIVSEMLADAVELGMQRAAVPGYRIAGKSGTAEIGEEGYRGRHAIVSFVGYGPLPDPQFVILVKLDKPTQGRWGLEVAAPAFREMAEFLIDYNALLPELFTARAP